MRRDMQYRNSDFGFFQEDFVLSTNVLGVQVRSIAICRRAASWAGLMVDPVPARQLLRSCCATSPLNLFFTQTMGPLVASHCCSHPVKCGGRQDTVTFAAFVTMANLSVKFDPWPSRDMSSGSTPDRDAWTHTQPAVV